MTSVFFQNYEYTDEQQLLHDLIEESISIYGIDAYYLPRKLYSLDKLYTEDPQSYFDEAIPFDVYVKSADQFMGDRNLMSRFGLEIRDQVVFTFSQRAWARRIGDTHGFARPNEGDLIFFMPNKRLFEIRYVEKYSMLYPLGTLPTWDVTTELYEAAGQHFDTGVADIDAVETRTSEDSDRWAVCTVDGSPIATVGGDRWVVDTYSPDAIDPLDQSTEIQTEADAVLDFSESDPFSEGTY